MVCVPELNWPECVLLSYVNVLNLRLLLAFTSIQVLIFPQWPANPENFESLSHSVSAASPGCHVLAVTLNSLSVRQGSSAWVSQLWIMTSHLWSRPLVRSASQATLTSQQDGYLWKGSWRSTCLAPASLSYSSGAGWNGSIGQTGSTESTPKISSPVLPEKWHSMSSHRWPVQRLELQLLMWGVASQKVNRTRRACGLASVVHEIALLLPVHSWGWIRKFPI